MPDSASSSSFNTPPPASAQPPPDAQTPKSTVAELIRVVLDDRDITPEQKIKLIDEIRKINPTASDRWAYRWCIWILGGSVVVLIGCVTALALCKVAIPEGLLAIGTAIVGALAGLLSGSNPVQANRSK